MTKLTLQQKITADVDDGLYALTKKIQKKYKLSSAKAKDHTNWSLRVLMLSFPEEWLKNNMNKTEREYHFIKDRKLREGLRTLGAVIGIIGILVAIASFIW